MNTNDTPPAVTVIGAPGCVQCTATERTLDAKGLAFTKRDAAELTHVEAVALRQALGNGVELHLPVVIAAGTAWTGFRPDYIDQLAAAKEER